ncbi:MAG: hypothetical protein NTZ85_08345 [Bacteroidia bacterium]|nr:hypothetical protein [Bacteroidia bacterium]
MSTAHLYLTLDYLSPHTTRDDNRHWEVAVKEIEYLLKKYNKPVVDDEPARRGTPQFGGPKNPVLPTDHIIHIYKYEKPAVMLFIITTCSRQGMPVKLFLLMAYLLQASANIMIRCLNS